MVYIMAGYYTVLLGTWCHYVILVRSNQEGFSSGQDFCAKRNEASSVLVVLWKYCAAFLGFWCE